MKPADQIVEALKRHYGQGYAYPCDGCPYGGTSRDDNCRFELTRDALELIEQYIDRNNRLNDHLLEKEAYIERLHRRGNVAQFAYEPGELVFAPAKLFDRRSTHFDFKVIDDPDRPVPARVTACVYSMDDTRYEIKALDKNQRMQGMRIVVSAQHLIRAENMLKGAYGK